MKFTIYTAECTGNPKNKLYPCETVITSAADMKKSARFDHVCAKYKRKRTIIHRPHPVLKYF